MSADVGGSGRVRIGGRRAAEQQYVAGQGKRRRSLSEPRRFNLRQHREGGSDAVQCAGHRLRAIASLASVAVLPGSAHIGRHAHLDGHGARLNGGHTHPHGDENREEESKQLSNRPAFHGSTEDRAKPWQKQAASPACDLTSPYVEVRANPMGIPPEELGLWRETGSSGPEPRSRPIWLGRPIWGCQGSEGDQTRKT